MAKKDNYESINVTIDTREKDTIESQKRNKTRMKIVTDFFEGLGAIVERKKVEYCDYSITGTFYRNDTPHDINLGIQYKTLNGDFFPSLPTLPEVLFRAHSLFTHVSLVVEENGHELLMNDDHTDGMFQCAAMQAACEKTGTGLYSSYKNFMQSMAESKIQARAIRTSEHFPVEIMSIMKYITKPFHEGLSIRPQNQWEELANSFSRFPGVGVASVEKLLQYVPNLEVLAGLQVDELQMVLGSLKGKNLYRFMHDNTRKEITSKAWESLYAKTPKKEVICEKPNIKHADDFQEGPVTNLYCRDVLTKIRMSPDGCSMEDIKKALGWSELAIFDELMALRATGKIWKNNKTRLWCFGKDKNEVPITAGSDLDVGV